MGLARNSNLQVICCVKYVKGHQTDCSKVNSGSSHLHTHNLVDAYKMNKSSKIKNKLNITNFFSSPRNKKLK